MWIFNIRPLGNPQKGLWYSKIGTRVKVVLNPVLGNGVRVIIAWPVAKVVLECVFWVLKAMDPNIHGESKTDMYSVSNEIHSDNFWFNK